MKTLRLLQIGVISFALAFGLTANAASAKFSTNQVKQIQQIVHSYLVKNPTVLVEASRALQKQQYQAAQKQAHSGITQNFSEIFTPTKDTPVVGNPKGTVTIVEFFDYQCPHCKVMAPIIEKLIKANPNLRVILREWPIFGGDSQYAAIAALASVQQNKYWDFHSALFAHGYPLQKDTTLKIAKSVGLDTTKLQKDMQDAAIKQQLKDNFTLAGKLKIIGAPAFVIGNTKTKTFKYLDGQTDQATLQKQLDAVK